MTKDELRELIERDRRAQAEALARPPANEDCDPAEAGRLAELHRQQGNLRPAELSPFAARRLIGLAQGFLLGNDQPGEDATEVDRGLVEGRVQGLRLACERMHAVLDGRDKGQGDPYTQPLEELRQRLLNVMRLLEAARTDTATITELRKENARLREDADRLAHAR